MYPNRNARNLWIQTAKKEVITGTTNGKISDTEGKGYVSNSSVRLLLSSFLSTICSTETMTIISNIIANTINQQDARVISWYTYAIYDKDSVLNIDESKFIGRMDWFNSCTDID